MDYIDDDENDEPFIQPRADDGHSTWENWTSGFT